MVELLILVVNCESSREDSRENCDSGCEMARGEAGEGVEEAGRW